MRLPRPRFALLLPILALSACASLGQGAGDQRHALDAAGLPQCWPQAHRCTPAFLPGIDEAALHAHTGPVRVECPMAFFGETEDALRTQCRTLVEASVVLLNARMARQLVPVAASEVAYRYESGCLPPAATGREQNNCFTRVTAQVPLRWTPEGKRKRAAVAVSPKAPTL